MVLTSDMKKETNKERIYDMMEKYYGNDTVNEEELNYIEEISKSTQATNDVIQIIKSYIDEFDENTSEEKKESYLQNLFIVESNPQELLKLFINNINSYATRVLKYIAIYLETYSDLVFLSLDKSKIVFRSNLGTADVLYVRTSRINFKLFPLIVKDEVEYFNNYKSFKYGVIECI